MRTRSGRSDSRPSSYSARSVDERRARAGGKSGSRALQRERKEEKRRRNGEKVYMPASGGRTRLMMKRKSCVLFLAKRSRVLFALSLFLSHTHARARACTHAHTRTVPLLSSSLRTRDVRSVRIHRSRRWEVTRIDRDRSSSFVLLVRSRMFAVRSWDRPRRSPRRDRSRFGYFHSRRRRDARLNLPRGSRVEYARTHTRGVRGVKEKNIRRRRRTLFATREQTSRSAAGKATRTRSPGNTWQHLAKVSHNTVKTARGQLRGG